MTTREQITIPLRQFLVNECGLPEDLSDETALFGPGMLDSVEVLQMILFIEKEFGLKMPLFEVSFENFHTVERIAKLVESRM